MKRLLLAITLVLGVNQSIQPSYAAKFLQWGKTNIGNILLTSAGGYLAAQEVLSHIRPELANNQVQFNQLKADLNGLVNNLNKKESHWYDSLGTAGAIIGGTFTAYRLLQYGISEYMGFMQILGLINMIKGGQAQDTNDHQQPEQPQGPRKLRPAQRAHA